MLVLSQFLRAHQRESKALRWQLPSLAPSILQVFILRMLRKSNKMCLYSQQTKKSESFKLLFSNNCGGLANLDFCDFYGVVLFNITPILLSFIRRAIPRERNPAYRRPWLSRHVPIVAPRPKRIETDLQGDKNGMGYMLQQKVKKCLDVCQY